MWIEVGEWGNERSLGVLRSEPFYATGMQAGQMIDVEIAKVYDYLRKFPGGAQEGNETGKIIEMQQAPQESR